jgi:two-component system, NarL family, nitrate/nitrite response regulator NarL
MSVSIRIVVIDDHPIMRDGILSVFAYHGPNFEVVATGGTAAEAIVLARSKEPNVMLLDLGIPGGGIEATAQISSENSSVKVIIFTVSENSAHIVSALDAGAKGYVLKGTSSDELVRAIVSVSNGNTYVSPELAGKLLSSNRDKTNAQIEAEERLRALSAREVEILNLLNCGNSNKDIARQLDIAEKTVKYFMTAIFNKLAVKNRLEAVVFFRNTHPYNDLRSGL